MKVENVSMKDWNREKGKLPLKETSVPQKQMITYTILDQEVRFEVDLDKCCEFSKLTPGSEVHRVCTLQEDKVYGGKEKVKVEHPGCEARVYSQFFQVCPIRMALVKEG
jgi:hypothetical protein